MNKLLKKFLSVGLSVCMLPAFGFNPGVSAAPVSSYNYNFDKASEFDNVKKMFYEKYQMNGDDVWHSALEHSMTRTDSLGDTTGAVHIAWDKYDAIGKNDKGTDSFIRFSNPDYSGRACTSFDFMLDNANSSVWVYDRVPVGGSNKSLTIMKASATAFQILEKNVDINVVAGTWYHVSIVTEYDGDKTVTGSAWVNGEKVITDAQKVYTQKPDCIDGSANGANFLTFAAYYSGNGKAGAWFDNIGFNQAESMNINNASLSPLNGSVIESGDITYVFGADIDATDFDVSDISLTKDGESIAFEEAGFAAGKLKLKIADSDITPGAAFEITLPELKDVLGNSLEESKKIINYSAEAPEPEIPLELVSPRGGGYIEKDADMVLTADAEEAAESVSFWVNGEKVGDGVPDGGLWKCKWQAKRYGEAEITVKYGEYEDTSSVKVMKATEQSGVWALSGSNLGEVPTYDGDDGRNPAYPLSGSRAVDCFSATEPKINVVKGGIYSLEADVYTDSNGNGVIPAISTVCNAMTNSVNLFAIQDCNLYSKRSGELLGEKIFGKNQWHTFKTVIDMTGSENTYDVYIDGIQYGDDLAFSNDKFTESVGRIKIQLTNQTEGNVFLDKVSLKTLTESSGLYSFNVAPADGSYIEAGDAVMLTAELVDDSDEPVDFETVSFYVNDEYLGEGEKLSDSVYGLEWIPEIAGEITVRIEASADGQDFEKQFEVEVFDLYHKEQINTRSLIPNAGTIVLTSESETAANSSNASDTSVGVSMNGFKVQGSDSGSSSYVQINAGTITKGFVIYEFDIHFENTEQGVRVYNRPGDTNVPDTGINFVKGSVLYGDENSISVDSGYDYEAGKWYNVKIVWNVDEGTKDLYLDGVQIANEISVKFSPGRNISQIRTEITNLWKSAGSADIKNETLRFAAASPEMKSIKVYDADGGLLDASNLDITKADAIVVSYSQALLTRTISQENVKLRRGFGKQIEITDITVLPEGETGIRIELGENALENSSHYVLTLEGIANTFGVVADEAEFEIRTAADVKGIYQATFTLNGNEISDITELFEGNMIVFEAKAVSPVAEKCYAIITVNSANGKLAAMSVTPVSFDSANSETDVTASIRLNFTPSDGDVVKAFLWDANTLPFGDEFILD